MRRRCWLRFFAAAAVSFLMRLATLTLFAVFHGAIRHAAISPPIAFAFRRRQAMMPPLPPIHGAGFFF